MNTEGGEAGCEACYNAENTRFALVMARGSGEGRDPIKEEVALGFDKGYERPLEPVSALDWFAELTPSKGEDDEEK